ncbi:Ribosomal_protein L7Ae [Hexamita inflata]|uniref:H/ACA ribonucleoprotein complex subunit 2 n=1 Tax=Hexamita inflata TaxID=28002 RepID=A0AA86RT32_9EUKA|nr:Ribosomal protein L7Ae [Hexamita inflata]CAI9977464.1 Ribosomal protein L7Ae [Hexamita inflata]
MQIDPRCYPLANEDLTAQVHNLIQQATTLDAVTCGANQVTKQLNHGKATLVVLAADCDPLEIILHLVLVCEDKGVPYVFVPSQQVIGNLAQLSKSVAAMCFSKHDAIQHELLEIVKKVEMI